MRYFRLQTFKSQIINGEPLLVFDQGKSASGKEIKNICVYVIKQCQETAGFLHMLEQFRGNKRSNLHR